MQIKDLRLLASVAAAAALVFAPPLARSAAGQDRPPHAFEIAGGALLFADDSLVTEGFVGGAGRFYVLPRISVGPEFAFIQGDNHSHVMVTGNVTIDLLGPVNGKPRPVTPFVVVGGGLFRTRELFPNRDTFWSGDPAFTAGGGIRGLIGRRGVVGAEARIGWELHVRLNAFFGVTFGG